MQDAMSLTRTLKLDRTRQRRSKLYESDKHRMEDAYALSEGDVKKALIEFGMTLDDQLFERFARQAFDCSGEEWIARTSRKAMTTMTEEGDGVVDGGESKVKEEESKEIGDNEGKKESKESVDNEQNYILNELIEVRVFFILMFLILSVCFKKADLFFITIFSSLSSLSSLLSSLFSPLFSLLLLSLHCSFNTPVHNLRLRTSNPVW